MEEFLIWSTKKSTPIKQYRRRKKRPKLTPDSQSNQDYNAQPRPTKRRTRCRPVLSPNCNYELHTRDNAKSNRRERPRNRRSQSRKATSKRGCSVEQEASYLSTPNPQIYAHTSTLYKPLEFGNCLDRPPSDGNGTRRRYLDPRRTKSFKNSFIPPSGLVCRPGIIDIRPISDWKPHPDKMQLDATDAQANGNKSTKKLKPIAPLTFVSLEEHEASLWMRRNAIR